MLKDCKYFEGTGNFCSRVTAMRCDEFPECEFKYIAELKAENEKLRTCLEMQRTDETKQYITKVNVERENYKLKSTLQEIKEIAENEIKELTDSAIYGGRYLEILNLITKAESEEV